MWTLHYSLDVGKSSSLFITCVNKPTRGHAHVKPTYTYTLGLNRITGGSNVGRETAAMSVI